MTAPQVSVIMASYNSAPFIAESIGSVLEQTHESLELIVVDDCSTDGTTEIIADYAARYTGRVQWKRKRVREGPCRARNEALELARGSLLCWMDHDDTWSPTKVAEQVRTLEERPEVGLVYTYFDAVDSYSGETLHWPDGRRDLEGDVVSDLVMIGCFIGSITTMFRRSAMARSGGRLRDRDFSIGDDYYLWLTIALDWQVARIPRVLAWYRRHEKNESSRVAEQIDFDAWRRALIDEFLAEFPEARDRIRPRDRILLALQLGRAAGRALRRGKVGRAGRETAQAARLVLPSSTRRSGYSRERVP
jgi:glycosyltransferase involved in cell wall biosynthesis